MLVGEKVGGCSPRAEKKPRRVFIYGQSPICNPQKPRQKHPIWARFGSKLNAGTENGHGPVPGSLCRNFYSCCSPPIMATVRSLGLHVPSALPFLIAENLLPPDPSDDQYSWKTCVDEGPDGSVADEIVWTRNCVVWSRAGIVTRVFRLDLEKEEIRHALITHFVPGDIKKSSGDATQGLAGGQARGNLQG